MAVDPFTPWRRLLYADYTVLCSAPDGTITAAPEGLFDHDTRILSRHRLTVDGQALRFVSTADLASDRRLIVLLAPRPGGSAIGPALPQDAVEVRVEVLVGPGMVERITLANRSMVTVTPTLGLEVDADFADVLEVGRARRQKGKTTRRATADGGLELTYLATRGERRIERGVRILPGESPLESDGRTTLAWRPELKPGGISVVELTFESLVDGEWRRPEIASGPRDESRLKWRASRPIVESQPELVGHIADRAMEDLFALRNRELDGDDPEFIERVDELTGNGSAAVSTRSFSFTTAESGPSAPRGRPRTRPCGERAAGHRDRHPDGGKQRI